MTLTNIVAMRFTLSNTLDTVQNVICGIIGLYQNFFALATLIILNKEDTKMDKYLIDVLMSKTDEQLNKELTRRGYTSTYYRYLSKESKIEQIIEHEAYWKGVNDARKGQLRNGKKFESNFIIKQPDPPKRHLCFLTGEYDDYPTAMKLTQEQANLMRYLLNEGFLGDATFVQAPDNSEIVAP